MRGANRLPHIPDIAALLEVIRAREPHTADPFPSPGHYLDALERLRDAMLRRQAVRHQAAEVLAAAMPQLPEPPSADQGAAPGPDSQVDRLIEEFLAFEAFEARIAAAERRVAPALRPGSTVVPRGEDIAMAGAELPPPRLFAALQSPSRALVHGVVELVDELASAVPPDTRVGTLVVALCMALHRRPALTPVAALRRWVDGEVLADDDARAAVYARLAVADPAWIVARHFADAAALALTLRHRGFFSAVGAVYPALLAAFVQHHLDAVHWDGDTAPFLLSELEQSARERPAGAPLMLAAVERLQGAPPPPGTLDFRYNELQRLRGTLAALSEGPSS